MTTTREKIIALLEQGRNSRDLQVSARAQKEIIVLIEPMGDRDENDIEALIARYMGGQTAHTSAQVAAMLIEKEKQLTQIINLTPHTIYIVNSDDEIIRTYPSQGSARVATTSQVVGEVDGVSISRTAFGQVQGLPDPDGRTVYIVSMVVAQAVSGRDDVVAPDSGPTAYRYAEGPQKGQIIGVRGFVRY